MSTVQVASAANSSECSTGTENLPSAPDLQRNSLVSDDSSGNSEALKLLREQLRSSVSTGYPINGVGAVTKSLSEERCSTPLVAHPPPNTYRPVGHSLSSLSSPIPPRQTSSLPCSPRNGLNVMQSLSTGQMTSPVQRMVSSSTAHPSSMIPPYTSPAGGSSVFAPLNGGRSLMNSHSTPATPSQLKNAVMTRLLSPMHPVHAVRSAPSEPIASPSSSPRPGILRKRNTEGVSKTGAVNQATGQLAPATKLDNSLRSLQSIGSTPPSTSSSPGLEAAAPARKKPRKQNMVTKEDPLASNVPPAESRSGSTSSSAPTTPAPVVNTTRAKESVDKFPFRKRMPANYGAGYKSTTVPGTKAPANHFQRSSDVRVKEEKRPTMAELVAKRSRLHDLQGWKINHLVSNLETLEKMELNKIKVVNSYLEQLPCADGLDKESAGELHMVAELLKGNLQRSKVLVEHIEETKQHLYKLFEHRPRVIQLFSKFNGKQQQRSSSTTSTSSANGTSSSNSSSKRKT